MFFGSFAWSFVFVSLPFHIQRVSTLDPSAGITSLVTVLTALIWGRDAARGNPKACCAMGAASTLGFIMVGRGVEGGAVRRRVAALQSSMTVGQVMRPLCGAGFFGPVAATSLLAWTSPAAVYCLLASIGLACLPLVRMRESGARP